MAEVSIIVEFEMEVFYYDTPVLKGNDTMSNGKPFFY